MVTLGCLFEWLVHLFVFVVILYILLSIMPKEADFPVKFGVVIVYGISYLIIFGGKGGDDNDEGDSSDQG